MNLVNEQKENEQKETHISLPTLIRGGSLFHSDETDSTQSALDERDADTDTGDEFCTGDFPPLDSV